MLALDGDQERMFGGISGGMRDASDGNLLGISSDSDGLPIVPPWATGRRLTGELSLAWR